MQRRAKIIATIGPSSRDISILRDLFLAGVNVARLNFSHGSHDDHAQLIKNIRKVSSELHHPVAILQDLQGPKLRVGQLPTPVDLIVGQNIVLKESSVPPLNNSTYLHIPLEVPEFVKSVRPGGRILLDDGNLELEVEEIIDNCVVARVILGGTLLSHKGVNLPGTNLNISGFTEKDRDDLLFGLQQGIDWVAISFVRSAKDIAAVKTTIQNSTCGNFCTPVIAKLELPDAIDNLIDILKIADGVMVARGDLGVEMNPAKVPSIQKHIIKSAAMYLKPVITATQMLDSMIHNPRPTRAEASDVANAIFDGSDAVMLSGETANGQYPLETVQMMESIVREAEAHSEWFACLDQETSENDDDALSVAIAARELAHDRDVTAIAVFTRSGRSATYLSKLHPRVPIIAFTPEKSTYNQLSLLWGVIPFHIPFVSTLEKMINVVEQSLKTAQIGKPGQQIVLVSGFPVGDIRPPNLALLYTLT